MKHGLGFSLFPLLIASGCTVGPDYEKPTATPPKAFVSQNLFATLNETSSKPFNLEWWTGFESQTLNTLIEESLEENFEIKAAYSRLLAAKEGVRLAGAGDGLETTLRAENSLEETKILQGQGADTTTDSHSLGLDLTLPVDLFGKTKREVQAACARYEQAKAEMKSIVLRISAEVASEYLLMRGNQRQLELLRESVALQEKTLSIVKSRFEAGIAPELDLRRAETSVENLRADIPPLDQALLNSRNRLATLAGKYPGAFDSLLKEIQPVPLYQNAIPALIPMDVLASRPDVMEAEGALKEAIARIGIAEADFYPIIELRGSLLVGTTGTSALPATDFLIGSISSLIEQILTDGGERRANYRIAKARADEALANYEQTLREATEDVERNLAAINASLARQTPLQKSVESSQRSFLQAETLYQQGLISFLDVVDAQRVLADAEQALAREQTNYSTQIAFLFQSLGMAPPYLN